MHFVIFFERAKQIFLAPGSAYRIQGQFRCGLHRLRCGRLALKYMLRFLLASAVTRVRQPVVYIGAAPHTHSNAQAPLQYPPPRRSKEQSPPEKLRAHARSMLLTARARIGDL